MRSRHNTATNAMWRTKSPIYLNQRLSLINLFDIFGVLLIFIHSIFKMTHAFCVCSHVQHAMCFNWAEKFWQFGKNYVNTTRHISSDKSLLSKTYFLDEERGILVNLHACLWSIAWCFILISFHHRVPFENNSHIFLKGRFVLANFEMPSSILS